MIRLTYLLRRKPGMTLAEFQTYWRKVHGPLVAGMGSTLNLIRYVQVHTLVEGYTEEQASGARGKMEEPYDGVAELWWNSRNDLIAARESQIGKKMGEVLFEDEKKFIDFPNSPLWFAYEYPQINPTPEDVVATEHSSLVKFYYILRQLPGLSMEEAQLYWRTNHGPLIRRIGEAGQFKRYIQVHRYPDQLEIDLRAARNTVVEPYFGHAELWFERNTAVSPSPERTRGNELAIEDESKFIDFQRSSMWFAKEYVFVDYH